MNSSRAIRSMILSWLAHLSLAGAGIYLASFLPGPASFVFIALSLLLILAVARLAYLDIKTYRSEKIETNSNR